MTQTQIIWLLAGVIVGDLATFAFKLWLESKGPDR